MVLLIAVHAVLNSEGRQLFGCNAEMVRGVGKLLPGKLSPDSPYQPPEIPGVRRLFGSHAKTLAMLLSNP